MEDAWYYGKYGVDEQQSAGLSLDCSTAGLVEFIDFNQNHDHSFSKFTSTIRRHQVHLNHGQCTPCNLTVLFDKNMHNIRVLFSFSSGLHCMANMLAMWG